MQARLDGSLVMCPVGLAINGVESSIPAHDSGFGSSSPVAELASAGQLVLQLRKLGGTPPITLCASSGLNGLATFHQSTRL